MNEQGVEAVAKLVADAGWSYPISTRRLMNEYALYNIELDNRGNTLMLGEIVDPHEMREFTSRADLEEKLRPIVEQHRAERQTGLIGRIRRYFQ